MEHEGGRESPARPPLPAPGCVIKQLKGIEGSSEGRVLIRWEYHFQNV